MYAILEHLIHLSHWCKSIIFRLHLAANIPFSCWSPA